MKIHIEVFDISNDQAHCIIVLDDTGIQIPFSMPLQSFETAKENNLLDLSKGPLDEEPFRLLESPVFKASKPRPQSPIPNH